MRIVLRMAGNERDAFVFTGEQVGIAVFRFGQDFQVGVISDQLCRKIGVARMRGQESVIETTRQQRMRVKDVVFVYARKFVAAGLLGNTIQDIQCGLYRPTDKQGGRDVIFCPLQHLPDLWPVGNVIKFHQTQRCAGDDQPIEILIANIFKITVEVIQMLSRRVA